MSELVFADPPVINTREFYPMIPIYDVHYDPTDLSNVVAIPIDTNNFQLLMQDGNQWKITPVDYEIYRQDQEYALELEEKRRELEETDRELNFDPEVKGNILSPEEEMTSIRANQLYAIVMEEWDDIVLGKTSGDFERTLDLQMQQRDYFTTIVYERAWEVHDIITTFVEGKYQPETLFGNYKQIYEQLQTKNGKECARDLVRLARLMSRCVSPEVTMRTEEIVESTVPAQAMMKNA